jgi:general stress protein 26
MNKKKFFRNWLKSHVYCVIATAYQNKPWAATVNYTTDDDLNIYISTSPASLKYLNATRNSMVAVVVDSQTRAGTLQIQGEARHLKGEPFREPNLLVVPKYLIFKKKDEKRNKLTVMELQQ